MRLKSLHQFPRLHRPAWPARGRERVVQPDRPVAGAGEDICRRGSGVCERVDGVGSAGEGGDWGGGEGRRHGWWWFGGGFALKRGGGGCSDRLAHCDNPRQFEE